MYTGVGIIGAIMAMHGRISVGQLSCFLTYANQYTKPFNEISGVVTEFQNALASAERVFELIDEKIEEAQRQLNRALEDATKTTDARALEDALTRQRQAKNDIEYWNRCRSQANYNQTVSHIKSDSIINKANEALNNLHDTLHHK